MSTWAERRNELIREWKDYVWQSNPDELDCMESLDADIENHCNCYDCRTERSMEITPQLLRKVYDLGFIPRNLDESLNFNDTEPDAYYEEDSDRIHLLLNTINQLRKTNKRMISAWKADDSEEFSTRKIGYCYDCGTVHKLKGAMRIGKFNGKVRTLCGHCSRRYIKCAHCGEIRLSHNSKRMPGSPEKRICQACYTTYYRKCSVCQNIKPKGVFQEFPMNKNDRGEVTYFSLCDECSIKMKKCDLCGMKVPIGILQVFGPNSVCPACSEIFTSVHRHAYSPLRMNFQKSKLEGKVTDKTLYFGFELEIESNGSWVSSREAMADILKHQAGVDRVYVVADGSLSHGVEMVSHPFTWAKWKEDQDHWASVLRFAKNKGWESDFGGVPGRTVGMHIHTSKAAWGTFQLYKMMSFMYNPRHRSLLTLVGQREPNQYCRFSSEDRDYMKQLAKEKRNMESTHYNVVNLNDKRSYTMSGGGATVEFRLFSGTLEPLHFFKNIEFVYAIYCFSRDKSRKQMTEGEFLKYLRLNRRTFPALAEFIGITKGGK